MSACKDLTGLKFGELTVVSKSNKRASNGGVYWNCKCSCGCEKEILGQSLKNGKTISCGHKGKENLEKGRGINFQDLTNQEFGKLIVLKRVEDKIYNNRKFVQWECKCKCGNHIKVISDNLKSGNTQSCGFCENNSHGNIAIEKLLNDNNINFIREKRFETCKDKTYLPFDFYVNDKYLIEYDGRQHFSDENTIFNYNETLKHDKIKNQWCKENNIPLIRIPYTHLKDLCIEDLKLETSKFIIN
jgi:hypothetical protein